MFFDLVWFRSCPRCRDLNKCGSGAVQSAVILNVCGSGAVQDAVVLNRCGSGALHAAGVLNMWFRSCPGCRGSEHVVQELSRLQGF